MNDHLKLSPAGANLIKHFESCLKRTGDGRYKAYICPGGRLTIGWGHTNDHGRKFDAMSVWTRAECDAAFLQDMKFFEMAVKKSVRVPLTQYQFDALVSFAYNCGPGNLKKLVGPRLNRGDYEATARAFHLYNRGGGKILNGLVRRRASEALLFQGIADADYDGKADAHAEPDEVAESYISEQDAMPQTVDAPEPPKPPTQSKSVWTSITVGATGMFGVFSQWFEQVRDLIYDPNVLLILTTIMVLGTVFLVHDRVKKLNEDYV